MIKEEQTSMDMKVKGAEVMRRSWVGVVYRNPQEIMVDKRKDEEERMLSRFQGTIETVLRW